MSTVFLERKLIWEVVTGTGSHLGVACGSLLFLCYINMAFTKFCAAWDASLDQARNTWMHKSAAIIPVFNDFSFMNNQWFPSIISIHYYTSEYSLKKSKGNNLMHCKGKKPRVNNSYAVADFQVMYK